MSVSVAKAEPQFTKTVTSQSKTGDLYEWLKSKDYLWMLDSPFDTRLGALAGSLPVTRMWYRRLNELGGEPVTPPDEARKIDRAFVQVDRVIRERFSDDD